MIRRILEYSPKIIVIGSGTIARFFTIMIPPIPFKEVHKNSRLVGNTKNSGLFKIRVGGHFVSHCGVMNIHEHLVSGENGHVQSINFICS